MQGKSKSIRNWVHRKAQGAVLILSMIFLLIFSALAVSLATMTSANIEIANNHRQANRALESALSGLEIVRYHLSEIRFSGTVEPKNRLATVAANLQSNLAAAGITNININYDATSATINVAAVTLNSQSNQNFGATLGYGGDFNALQVDVLGNSRQLNRQIRGIFDFAEACSLIFDYGIATKGPLHLTGTVSLEGESSNAEAGIYIAGENDDALTIDGSASLAGDVRITNPDATVSMVGGQGSIGGETGQAAIDNHVSTGVENIDLPVPNTGYFEQYVTSTLDPATYQDQLLFENIRIPSNINPFFAAGVTLKGVIFIETPNIITFTGHASIIGILVGDGNLADDPATSQIVFLGSVDSHPISTLPDQDPFTQLRNETGTFILAPGFSVTAGGTFNATGGSIACNGFQYSGNSGGTIRGTIVNYCETPVLFDGNATLEFDNSAVEQTPAGFTSDRILEFQPDSYSEIAI